MKEGADHISLELYCSRVLCSGFFVVPVLSGVLPPPSEQCASNKLSGFGVTCLRDLPAQFQFIQLTLQVKQLMKTCFCLLLLFPVWGLHIQFINNTSKIWESPHSLMQCMACVLPLSLGNSFKVSNPTTAGLILWEWPGHSAFLSSLTLNCWSEINIVWCWEHSTMTVKLELCAASTKCSDTYSAELCAVSFMICLTGWKPVFCKISISRCMKSSKTIFSSTLKQTSVVVWGHHLLCWRLQLPWL